MILTILPFIKFRGGIAILSDDLWLILVFLPLVIVDFLYGGHRGYLFIARVYTSAVGACRILGEIVCPGGWDVTPPGASLGPIIYFRICLYGELVVHSFIGRLFRLTFF